MAGTEGDLDFFGLLSRVPPAASSGLLNDTISRQYLPNFDYPHILGKTASSYESEPQLCHNAFSESPPELSVSITPIEQEGPRLEDLMPTLEDWEQSSCDPIVSMGSEGDLTTAFDIGNPLENIASQDLSKLPSRFPEDARQPMPLSIEAFNSGATSQEGLCQMDIDSDATTVQALMGSEESDALLRSQESWPFFRCDKVSKPDVFPPKTATFYVEGLVRVLTSHDWQVSSTLDSAGPGLASKSALFGSPSEPSVSRTASTLNSVMQLLVSKACKTHCSDQDLADQDSIFMKTKQDARRVKLPPRDITARFVQSYVSHHEPYYLCAPDLRHGSMPRLQSNIQASHLLLLLAMAQGAAFSPVSAARYLASGLIEACRLFLFDSIEKDILLSRETIVLKSALLFTVAAAWSGDNWHMDIAMGQRGMYTSVRLMR